MEIEYNSSNPYNLTYALHRVEEKNVYKFLSTPYNPYHNQIYQLFKLVFAYLKNVRFQFASHRKIFRRLSNVTGRKMKNPDQYYLTFQATKHGIIDTAQLFFNIGPDEPRMVRVSPITQRNSDVILSSVRSDARRESSETLSFQGLSTLVWILVGFSLLVVSGLATYFSFKNEKKNRRERPWTSWMNNVCIYAADIVNNSVAGVISSGPGRNLRSWWLLGVVFVIQFWVAGMKSDLLVDQSTFIDSLEDLFSKPELILVMSKKTNANEKIFGDSEDDPRFKDYEKKIRYDNNKNDDKWQTILANGSGVILGQETTAKTYVSFRVKKLNEAKRKQYVGKKKYRERYSYAVFNKRLPRAIKEHIDYLISRLFETRQTQPRLKGEQFRSRKFLFDPTDDSASTMSWSPQSVVFLSPVFRLWLTGMSLAIFAFCVEFYLLRRKPVKDSIGIRIRA